MDQPLITQTLFVKFLKKKREFSRRGGVVYFHRVRHTHENRLTKMCTVEFPDKADTCLIYEYFLFRMSLNKDILYRRCLPTIF